MANFKIEREIIKSGYKAIAGVDEVGRGALFGPVVAAAVIFPCSVIKGKRSARTEEINDSKLLSSKKREELVRTILKYASSIGIGQESNCEIDRNNIYWASLSAMKKAVLNMSKYPDFLLVDGFSLNDVKYTQRAIPQGDRKSISIAAASIIAKVFRDEMMNRFDKIYEGYGLSKNKGYATKEHYIALQKMGPTPFHRFSFNLKGKKDGFKNR